MDEPDEHPNCRCIIIFTELPWQVEIHDLLDTHIGNTDPPFTPQIPKGIFAS